MNKRHIVSRVVCSAVMIFSMIICSCNIVLAAKVSLNKTNISLYVSESARLKVSGNSGNVSYKSGNNSIASVSSNGCVKAKKIGSTTITVSVGVKKYRCKVKVGGYATGIKLNSASMVTLSKGGTSKILAKVSGKKVLYKTILYTCADKSKVTVSKTGKITAIASGLTTITAKTKAVNKNGKSYSKKITVYVQEDDSTTVVTAPPANSVVITDTANPTASATVSNTSNPASTSNPDASPTATAKAYTIQDAVDAIQTPADTVLSAATICVQNGSSYNTLYFLNKNYTGTVSLSFFGKNYSTTRNIVTSFNSLLTSSVKKYYRDSNNVRILYITDNYGSCSATNMNDGQLTSDIINFTVFASDSIYSSPYALIVAEGDTRSVLKVNV